MKHVFTYEQLAWIRKHGRKHQEIEARFKRRKELEESTASDLVINTAVEQTVTRKESEDD
jgi:capsid protein